MDHLTEGCQCEGKICSTCNQLLCTGHFSKDNGRSDKLKHNCRRCAGIAYAIWREETRGQPPARHYKKMDLADRFFSKVVKGDEGECWLWTGGRKDNGYGVFCVERKNVYAHRWSYEYHRGPIPEGLEIDHRCQTRACVNPSHLEIATTKENILRSNSVSAQNARKTHCIYGHLYTEENTIRTAKGRRCRTCENQMQRERYVGKPREIKTHCPKGHDYERPGFCRICFREYDAQRKRDLRRGIVRQKQERTHCKRGHPYNEENTYYHPTSGKYCRLCRNERHPRYVRPPKNAPRTSQRGYTPQEWRDLKARYDHACLWCGRKEPDIRLVADHVLPHSLGGTDDIGNRQPLCRSCNSKKKDKFIDFRHQNT